MACQHRRMQTVMPGLGLQKFYSFGMETADAAISRVWKLQICPFEPHICGGISWSVHSTSILLDHERGHGNKILKDEQHLFTFWDWPKITEEKERSDSGTKRVFGILYC